MEVSGTIVGLEVWMRDAVECEDIEGVEGVDEVFSPAVDEGVVHV